MSHWAKIPCKYKDAESLSQALEALGYKDIAKGSHKIPNPYGDRYPSMDCDISAEAEWMVGDKSYGKIRFGFKRNSDGFYELMLDEHGKGSVNLKNLSRAYAEKLISNKFRGKYSVSSSVDGQIRLRRIGG
jgi:hypothetical protein